jgi:acyl-CoA thioester hydrolase
MAPPAYPAAGPTDERPPFRFSAFVRVGFDETDAQAVVYYGRYFPYFDRARVEYARHLDILDGLPAHLQLVMRHARCDYEAPARFDDLLEVFVRTARIGRTSVHSELAAYHKHSGTLLAAAELVLVVIDAAERRPAPVPDHYRRIVEAFEGSPA